MPPPQTSLTSIFSTSSLEVDFNTISRSEDSRLTNGLDLCMIDHHIKSDERVNPAIVVNNQISDNYNYIEENSGE